MRVLMISGDPNILDSNTGTGKRIGEYGKVLGELDILLAYGNIFRFVSAFLRGFRMLSVKSYDIITAQDVEHSCLAWLFSKIFGVPWQMQIHTDIFSPHFVKSPASPAGRSVFNKLRVRLAKFLLPRADCVRVVSERIKKSILRTSDVLGDIRCPIVVLPIFVDAEKIKNASMQTDLRKKYPNRFIILMVSRITKEKNIELAIEAFAEAIKELPPPRAGITTPLLLIVGDGPERGGLEKEALKLLGSGVKFEGWRDNLSQYYRFSDLFLATSNYEGYGMAVAEAVGSGLPVIMTDVGVAGELIRDGENGLVVPVGDKLKLKNAILRFVRDGSLRLRLKEGARKTERPYSSFDDYREKLINSWKVCQKQSP